MLKRKLYYGIKPYVPWSVRIAFRRISARKLRAANEATWPINASTARIPAGWPGWPDGKKFAFVLTHDVEGSEGVAKTQRLAELEIEHGFRSSFNFIPEGTYDVPQSLRSWLTDRGFEVGVHDLHHDGKLYDSREGFHRKAARINAHLQKWGASGFRSGFMLHELEWIHELEIEYDASTFDTDPFEPQPDGAGTIFPHWIAAPGQPQTESSARSGYVELPYTLPQDSTLFLVFREKSSEIWTRKLDWVAQHGGMGLVNVHPDYTNFSGTLSSREFPSARYGELLQHVKSEHAGRYWNPTPRELARWYKEAALARIAIHA